MKLENLYLIVGCSGSGKTTITQELARRFGYELVSSITDRPPRFEGETGHEFVSSKTFDAIGPLLAPTTISGYRYGIAKEQVDRCSLCVVDPYGVADLRRKYHDRPIKVIGIHVPKAEVSRRMEKRGDDAEMIQARLAHDAMAFNGLEDVCDIVLLNKDLEETIRLIQALIQHFEGGN